MFEVIFNIMKENEMLEYVSVESTFQKCQLEEFSEHVH